FLLHINRCSAVLLKAAQEIVSDVVDVDITREEIAQDVQHAQQANVDALKFFRTSTGDYSEEGKMLLLVTFRRILEREASLTELERNHLLAFGKAMGLRAKAVTPMLEADLSRDDA
ncbi:MAG: hypothetical protein KDA85_10270, partial [Planctomycetaceae bacterium]|nr:hypothetical protein [Planctomycetaceae bacterium]